MALHIVNAPQPQAPWWASIAERAILPMITGALERQRQRDENRKYNISLAETLKLASGGGTPTGLTPQPTTGGNGWEDAFRSTDNPLAGFDTNMSSLLPPSAQTLPPQQVTPTTNQPLTQDQIIQNYINTLANPRFSHLDITEGLKRLTPYLTAMEAARKEGLRNQAAVDFRNATDAHGRTLAIMPHVIAGNVPESLGTMVYNQDLSERPNVSLVNTGDRQRYINVDPVTGNVREVASFDNALTPQQAADNLYRDNVFTYQKEKDAREFAARREDNALANASRYSTVQAYNGKLYQIDQYGNIRALVIDGQHMDAPQNFQWDDRKQRELETYNSQIERLDKEIADLTTKLGNETDADTKAAIQKQLDSKRNDLNAYILKRKLLFEQPTRVTYKSPGGHMFGYGNNVITVEGGQYGANRGNYSHGGIDYAAREGTEIRTFNDMGTTRVTEVNTDPTASSYGCYVRLEGTYNNQRVRYTMAHMKQGSINVTQGQEVKPGEYIGGVGNTGRTSDREKGGLTMWYEGKKSGHHLHLEIEVWDGSRWQRVNPETFFTDTPNNTKQSGGNTGQPNSQGNGQPNTQGQGSGEGNNPNDPVVFEGPGFLPITQSQYNIALANALNSGEGYTQGSFDRSLEELGYHRVTPTDNNPQLANRQEQPNVQGNTPPVVTNTQIVPPIVSDDVSPDLTGQPAQIPPEIPEPQNVEETPNIAQANNGSFLGNAWNAFSGLFSATPAAADELPDNGTRGTNIPADEPFYIPPVNQKLPDPDGGLGEFRAEGDNSPVTWRTAKGNPMRTSEGQLFTQKIYDEWAQKADAGGFRDVGINNRADLDKWLRRMGMRTDRPAEIRGINALNGNPNNNLLPESEDPNIRPSTPTPSNSPERFEAPTFTDEINGTTPFDTQDLLDGLNGITDSRYRRWTEALKRFYPSDITTPQVSIPYANPETPNVQRVPANIPTRNNVTPEHRKAAPKPRAGYTNYEAQRNTVDGAAKKHGVDSELIRAIIQVESNWRPNARSGVGAMGLMQLMPKTAKWLGVKNAYDPAQNIEGGTKYIAQLIRQFGGDVSKALMAYNCGPGNVKKGRIPAESRRYAQKVMSIYSSLKGQR